MHWQLESIRRNWRRDLQHVGTTALMYADLDATSALAKHLTMLAAQGRQSATLRGVVSSIRMCETLGIVDTVVTPLHWAICKAADRAYAHPPPRRIWANVHTLQVPDARTSGPFGTAVVALACLGTALCWRGVVVVRLAVAPGMVASSSGCRGICCRGKAGARTHHTVAPSCAPCKSSGPPPV